MKLLSDGRILAVGYGTTADDLENRDIFLARFQSNGKLDTSFDDDGWFSLDFMERDVQPGLVVLDDHHYMISLSRPRSTTS